MVSQETSQNENQKKMVNIVGKILDSSKQQKSKRCPPDLANLIKILTPKQMLQRLPTQ